jgi:pyruvate-ferredoxin/flavodoxin oxidoreductase
VFLLNSAYSADEVFDILPLEAQEQIIAKGLRFYTIDAYKVAKETGMGGRINTIMQTCFFAISGVLPPDEAIAHIKKTIQKTYAKKGDEVVKRNWAAVDQTLENMFEVKVPSAPTTARRRPPVVSVGAPDFVQRMTAVMMEGHGDLLPVSAFGPDGAWPTATTQWEKRNIALDIPIWDAAVCIQCNKCSLVCPHAAIRAKVIEPSVLAANGKPAEFVTTPFKAKDFAGMAYRIQVAPEDCTGCGLCASVCPAKDKSNPKHKAIDMTPIAPVLEREKANYAYFLSVPDVDRARIGRLDAKFSQFMRPLFEYSGACAGCGETPYVKLLTQLFGDRMVIANATGCSSIYGGNLPSTPYCQDENGRGPAWSNSLFEDSAEFGYGLRLGVDAHKEQAEHLVKKLSGQIGGELADALLGAEQYGEANIAAQRERIVALRAKLRGLDSLDARRLDHLADYLVRKSVWSFGGDGWAYDIGYGGLDHVIAQLRDINILVLDTEVYSNTGGQASKSTPIGAAAKFAASGKSINKKDLGLMAMSYRHVYVASVALGAKDAQTVQAFVDAESYPGPSLIIAYSHCIAHGYDLVNGMEQQKLAVGSGIWPLYRYDPRRIEAGQPPLQLDTPASGAAKETVQEYMRNETRFRMVEKIDPHRFAHLAEAAQDAATQRVAIYQQMANIIVPPSTEADGSLDEGE